MTLREQVIQLKADLTDAELRLEEFRNGFDYHLHAAINERLNELFDNPDLLRSVLLTRAQSATAPDDLLRTLRALAVLDEIKE